MSRRRRVFLLVIDGLGVGPLPDAEDYGDAGSNTLLHAAQAVGLRAPALDRLGLGRVQPAPGLGTEPVGAYGRMAEASAGKDSMTGHWEIAGIVTKRPFQTYPDGFPPDIVGLLEDVTGGPVLGNVVSEGTAVLTRFGEQALATKRPIVYTSVDSVLQVAAHVDAVPEPTLYDWCAAIRRRIGHRVARVIARPFRGRAGAFERLNGGRRDFSVPLPPGSLLECLDRAGVPTVATGKVADLFPGHPFACSTPTAGDGETMAELARWVRELEAGFGFANAGDLDTKYGHRNDPQGWADGLERLDGALGEILAALRDDDVLAVTGDHGNDPTTPSTDHAREYVPVLAVSGAGWRRGGPGVDIGTRSTFADLGATVAELFLGHPADLPGAAFADRILPGG